MWSDGCSYRNRNGILSNALVHLASVHGVTAMQKYLEKGHIKMKCDSVHQKIEARYKDRKIYIPSMYAFEMKNARCKSYPYQVKQVNHTFFKDYTGLKYYPDYRPGCKRWTRLSP
jgi:hypothetical protein